MNMYTWPVDILNQLFKRGSYIQNNLSQNKVVNDIKSSEPFLKEPLPLSASFKMKPLKHFFCVKTGNHLIFYRKNY